MKSKATLAATLCAGTVLAGGDGFVPPPMDRRLPAPPPRSISSAETLLACCCCATSMSRTEAKRPPLPPVAITKLKH